MIEKFFEHYAHAFLSFEAEAINEFYAFPAILYSEEGDAIVFSQDDFIANSRHLLQKYKSIGVGKINFQILEESTISQSLKLVNVMWHFQKPDGTSIYSAQTNYVVKQDSDSYKIVSVIMVNEATVFSETLGEPL